MRAAVLVCVLATVHGWKMPKSSLLEMSGIPKCEVPKDFVRLPQLVNDSKARGSQRLATDEEMNDPNFLADPYLHTVYFINLNKSLDRHESMLKQLNNSAYEYFNKTGTKYHYERFLAKNKTEAKGMVKSDYTVNKENPYAGAGTVATYLSHWHMLDKIAKFNDSRAVFIVLEDDAVLTDGWVDEVMCQIKQLPADWDLFKFGYWPLPSARWAYDHSCSGGIRQRAYNKYTCNQRAFALEWMGNLGYATRPQGARKAIEHLRQVPIMDVDGAMMPGCCVRNSTNVAQNVYVSRFNLIRHGKFRSVRIHGTPDFHDTMKAGTTPDLTKWGGNAESDDERETSYQARVRIIEASKRGDHVDTWMGPEEDVDSEKKEQDKVTALAGLGA